MKFKNIEPEKLDELLKNPEVKVLDVRTPGEYARGSLPNAQLIPLHVISEMLGELPKDKSTPLLIFCAHGVRSLQAIEILATCGYTNLTNLKGGLAAYLHREP